MNTTGTGGFILNTIKVYDDTEASSVMANRRKAKMARLQVNNEEKMDDTTTNMDLSKDQEAMKAADPQDNTSGPDCAPTQA